MDIAPVDATDPVAVVRVVEAELSNFDAALAEKPRWLVLNKIDLLDSESVTRCAEHLRAELNWEGPIHQVSAATSAGCQQLAFAIMGYLEEIDSEP